MSSATSVFQRGDGYWVARLSVDGVRHTKYGKTKRDALARLGDLLEGHRSQTLTRPTRLTLAEWVTEWTANVALECRPSTLAGYRDVLAPVTARIGAVHLERLTPAMLSRTFTELRASGKGSRRVQMAYVVLRSCLGAAVRLRILNANPLDHMTKPTHQPRERTEWTLDDVCRFVQTVRSSEAHYAPLLLFMAATGVRISEALGLTWADLDSAAGSVTIRAAYVFVAGIKPTTGMQPPKTRSGRRVIVLPTDTLAVLSRLPRPLDNTAPVFVNQRGEHPAYSSVRAALLAACRQAQVPVVGPHQLRHAHASLLVANGIDIASVSRRLGHSKVSTTAAIYTHPVARDSVAAAAFDRAVSQ